MVYSLSVGDQIQELHQENQSYPFYYDGVFIDQLSVSCGIES